MGCYEQCAGWDAAHMWVSPTHSSVIEKREYRMNTIEK